MLLMTGTQAQAGPPYVTDDPEPVDYGHWEVYGFSAGAYRASDFTGVGPSMEVNYGALPNLQLHMILNTVFDTPAAGQLTRESRQVHGRRHDQAAEFIVQCSMQYEALHLRCSVQRPNDRTQLLVGRIRRRLI